MLSVFLLSRAFFFVVGAVAVAALPQAEPAGDPLNPEGFLGYWANWDGAWYALISTEGYAARAPESTAFFPLYPMLLGLFVRLGGSVAFWGVLLSSLFTALALFFLYAIAEKLFGIREARFATLALAFFPTAFYLNAVYSEAPFLALSAGCFWAAYVRRDFLLAGVLGAFAAATRNLGVLLVLPLFFEWWRWRRDLGFRDLLFVGLVPAGLLAYAGYLWARFGDPLLFAWQQGDYWGRTLTNPSVTAAAAWESAVVGAEYLTRPAALFLDGSPAASLAASNALNLVTLAFLLVVLGAGFFVLPRGLSIMSAVMVLLPVLTPSPSFPLMSMPRFALGVFPVFLVLGFVLARGRVLSYAWLVAGALLGAALAALFVTWRWVA
ncbi:glycosyltransferase family 39 protein [Rubrobacter radiotolerans]|uniref:Glycosyltransferase family 39 protein n=1 Tax=Rubrobacter radiotolerans TaxID=42256 RepID=A0AB35T4K0_RUBRA|nr:glycosyltransferase family 39 protein [Rubrobacter radiotolerans]MDX5894814.1 glycosyltransferase family 39 protein [Rubrobacter radiotolerans]SMC06816.1 Dolichyl-phosphate-mannose-protein mannosyltransferase [Rubrobacter radiotolerans DSM 5868]